MAEVLSPPMQTSSTITMLHSRPSSSDAFQGQPQQYSQPPRSGQQSRSMYNGQNTTGYRGTSAVPVQPYAFQATPHLRQETRTASASSSSHGTIGGHRHAHTQSASASSSTSSDASSQPSAKDDSVMGSRNGSLINLSSAIPDLSLTPFDQSAKPAPDRYRHRPAQKRTESGNAALKQPSSPLSASAAPSGSGMASVAHLVQQQPGPQRQESVDDIGMNKTSSAESAKRYRRRSMNNLDTNVLQAGPGAPLLTSAVEPSATSTPTTIRPVSFHSRSGSDESRSSQRKREPTSLETAKSSTHLKPEAAKVVHVPARASSDNKQKTKSPSPLSKETTDCETPTPVASPVKPRTYAAVAQAGVTTQSAAAQQLAAVSDKDLNKGMKSRLRRAFSFGSAQELRRAAADNSNDNAAQQAQYARTQHQQHIDDELDAESQEVARRQEAAGIGAGIYSGQGGFTGSMDNLSISSTASSASMMLRKMGRGAKKSAKSIKGLFRPKSVIGVPAADGPIATPGASIQPSMATVSMVTVEAERQKVNVNEHPGDRHHGITGFPKLERNSIDAVSNPVKPGSRSSGDGADSLSRRSIVGSDRDRAEVLAAVKKGILKRSGTGSPAGSPVIRPNDNSLQAPTMSTASPASSMPSTPKDGQSRNDSLKAANNNDYFSQRPTLHAKSAANTPNGSSRNISFSPRIQFHDAWSSTEYDRRGEIATCNRLTPMLAQQIKEELNTFKMEMEVHEQSKPHTHFF